MPTFRFSFTPNKSSDLPRVTRDLDGADYRFAGIAFLKLLVNEYNFPKNIRVPSAYFQGEVSTFGSPNFFGSMTWEGRVKTNLTALAEQAKAEVLDAVLGGQVPADVHSFEELHDYVDANDFGTSELDGDGDDYDIEVLAAMQDLVHEWIRSGGLWYAYGEAELV